MNFNSQIGQLYLLDLFGKFDCSTLSKCNKDIVKIVNVLCEFYDTSTLAAPKRTLRSRQCHRHADEGVRKLSGINQTKAVNEQTCT
ncbi:hypothetical protein [Sphingobacterium sp. HMA12]|uniref:hypothetical protein n=1 Tax=Sphingobacterium sp. HMA12 TaxID=2050894 RepID=UPI0013151480|nr:hypothetical protein [Sphingobacterium sp. HMA12]